MQRWGRLSFETGASHPPQDEAEYAQNLFLTLRRPRKRPSRRARPRRCNCVHSAMLAPMRRRGDDPDLPLATRHGRRARRAGGWIGDRVEAVLLLLAQGAVKIMQRRPDH